MQIIFAAIAFKMKLVLFAQLLGPFCAAAGSGLEKGEESGSGLEKTGSGLEKTGSGLKKTGSTLNEIGFSFRFPRNDTDDDVDFDENISSAFPSDSDDEDVTIPPDEFLYLDYEDPYIFVSLTKSREKYIFIDRWSYQI